MKLIRIEQDGVREEIIDHIFKKILEDDSEKTSPPQECGSANKS